MEILTEQDDFLCSMSFKEVMSPLHLHQQERLASQYFFCLGMTLLSLEV